MILDIVTTSGPEEIIFTALKWLVESGIRIRNRQNSKIVLQLTRQWSQYHTHLLCSNKTSPIASPHLFLQACMFLSSVYHTFCCHSRTVSEKCLSLDLAGITLALLATYLSGVYYRDSIHQTSLPFIWACSKGPNGYNDFCLRDNLARVTGFLCTVYFIASNIKINRFDRHLCWIMWNAITD